MEIREATIDDLAAVVDIWKEGLRSSLGYEPPPGDYDKAFRRKIEEQDANFKVFVAVDAGVVVGWQSLSPFRSNPVTSERMAELSAYMRASHLRSGIAKELLQHSLRHADSAPGLQYVTAFITAPNERALQVALAGGFVKVATMPPPEKGPFGPDLHYIVYTAKKPDSA
jgi:L-amino acid N-acyltransferase YncA